ncbi:hypothetical protein JW899_00150 [Candidatus Uhrbacteria bacterium]|nr:hypothetical protein [Candidatus Uhrbacteria bacterium]
MNPENRRTPEEIITDAIRTGELEDTTGVEELDPETDPDVQDITKKSEDIRERAHLDRIVVDALKQLREEDNDGEIELTEKDIEIMPETNSDSDQDKMEGARKAIDEAA